MQPIGAGRGVLEGDLGLQLAVVAFVADSVVGCGDSDITYALIDFLEHAVCRLEELANIITMNHQQMHAIVFSLMNSQTKLQVIEKDFAEIQELVETDFLLDRDYCMAELQPRFLHMLAKRTLFLLRKGEIVQEDSACELYKLQRGFLEAIQKEAAAAANSKSQ